MPRNNYHDTPVVEFHETFGAPVAWRPTVPAEDRRLLRAKLILEEFLEFLDAAGLELNFEPGLSYWVSPKSEGSSPNLIAVADALTDIRYVTDGACLEFGLPAEKLLREVHRSNMSKAGPDGKPILRPDGKVLKGPNFTPPDLKTILELYSHPELKNG